MSRHDLARLIPEEGEIIEAGPGTSPWPLPRRPVYVGIRGDGFESIPLDREEDGFALPSFAAGSAAAVVASHLLEHCSDPVGALRRWAEVLRPGGVILCAVPEKCRMFDFNREVTPYSLLRAVHEGGPTAVAAFAACQWADWETRHDGRGWAEAVRRAVTAVGGLRHIHYCVWDWQSLRVFLDRVLGDYLPGSTLETFAVEGAECLFTIRKAGV